jgi:hypothetical protein
MAAKFRIMLIASAALGMAVLVATATAQPYGPGAGFMGPRMMSGPGMMGPWMMGRRGFGAMCNPGANGFAEWRADRIAELVKLTDAQRSKFDEFKAASIKSAEVMRNACLTDVPENDHWSNGSHGKAHGHHAAGGPDDAARAGSVLRDAERRAKDPTRFELRSWPVRALARPLVSAKHRGGSISCLRGSVL